MKWFEAYKQMKEKGCLARRKCWGKDYIMWIKPEAMVRSSWCKDPILKTLVDNYGQMLDGERVLKAEAVFCLFNSFTIETGFELRNEDRTADDWEIINLEEWLNSKKQ